MGPDEFVIDNYLTQHPDAQRLPRSLGIADFEIAGCEGSRKTGHRCCTASARRKWPAVGALCVHGLNALSRLRSMNRAAILPSPKTTVGLFGLRAAARLTVRAHPAPASACRSIINVADSHALALFSVDIGHMGEAPDIQE